MLRQGQEKQVQITIVGLGFIGGSIGLALQESGEEIQITGHDREPSQAQRARKIGAIDRAERNLIHASEGADIVVLALPPDGLRDTLEAMAANLKPGCLTTDTATVKGAVMNWAEEMLPPQVAFVGGDPIVQSPERGLDGASADLFQDQLYCLTPGADVPTDAVQRMVELVRLLGAEPYFIDAQEHDGVRAAVEHLPALLIALLLREMALSAAPQELRRLRGQLLVQASELMRGKAATYPALCLDNSSAISHWSQAMRRELRELEQLIDTGDREGLEVLFEEVLSFEEMGHQEELPHPSLLRRMLWR
ncbi:MAG: prephenate dehydrogenase/arogenate dehydrogenase family protein [Chloroflexota bacterium]|nr:prephenate dehydrogenase/arogenate dehydrogenase family protein [Chloroflexota bacterium]